jgi:hypothetical protein
VYALGTAGAGSIIEVFGACTSVKPPIKSEMAVLRLGVVAKNQLTRLKKNKAMIAKKKPSCNIGRLVSSASLNLLASSLVSHYAYVYNVFLFVPIE